MKKIRSKVAILLAFSLVVGGTILPATASAHGHGHSRSSKKYGYCTVEDCIKTGTHRHNGKYYAGHTSYDGHNHH